MSNAKNLIEKRRAQKKHQAELARRAKSGYRPIQKKQVAQQPSIKFAPTSRIRTQTTTRGGTILLSALTKALRHCAHGVSGGFVNFWSAVSTPSFPRTTNRLPQRKVVAASIDPRTGKMYGGPGILNLDDKVCLRDFFCPDPQAEFFGKRFKSALKSGIALSLGFLKSAKIKSVVLKFGVAAALTTVFVAGPFVVNKTAELTTVPQPQPVASKIDLAQAKAARSEAFAKTVEAPAQNPALLATYATPSTLKDHLSAKVEPNTDMLFAPKAPASSFVEVIQIPQLPKALNGLLTQKDFERLPKDLIDRAAAFKGKVPAKDVMYWAADAGYALLNGQKTVDASMRKSAFNLFKKAAFTAIETGLKNSDFSARVNANLAWCLKNGVGTERDISKAVFHALLGQRTKVGKSVLESLRASSPDVVAYITADMPNIRKYVPLMQDWKI